MSTYDDRLTALEKTLAAFQREELVNRDELNRNATMLLGMVSSQQLDVKEIKIRLLSIDDRLGGVDQRLSTIEHRFDTVDQRFASLDEKLNQILQRLTNPPTAE